MFAAQTGVEEYLVAHHAEVVAVAPLLRATGKVELLRFLRAQPSARDAFVGIVAQLATDSAKSVREEAAGNLAALPAARQVELLEPLLTTMPASRLAGIVTHLVGVEGGVDALRRAHTADGRGARGRCCRTRSSGPRPSTSRPWSSTNPSTSRPSPPARRRTRWAVRALGARRGRPSPDRGPQGARGPRVPAQGRRSGLAALARRDTVKDLSAITDDHLRQVAQYLSGALTKLPRTRRSSRSRRRRSATASRA
ncbi:hypothetical protein NKG05_25480 [Oerskovia sp. M15]